MAYNVTLVDSTGSWTSDDPNTPLTEEILESSTEVVTLDMNMYVDLFGTKRVWTIQWGYMSGDDYDILRGYYDRQFSLGKFPEISIDNLGVNNVVAKMSLSNKIVTDESGLIENVELTLRETIQATDNYIVS